MNEINQYGSPVEPKDIYKNRDIPIGPGSKSLDDADAFIIYLLYSEEPSRILSSYVEGLEHIRGTVVSEATVHHFLRRGFLLVLVYIVQTLSHMTNSILQTWRGHWSI